MDDKKVLIGDRTKFTFAAVVAMLGFSAWLTMIYFQGQANAAEINEIKARLDRLEALEIDVAVIKQDVKTIDKKIDSL